MMKMKARLQSAIFAFLMVLGICAMPAYASTTEVTIKMRLAPYQEVIDRVNFEFGCAVTIPDGEESNVYQNLINRYSSVEEFEKELRREVENTEELNGENITISVSDFSNLNDVDGSSIMPYYVLDDSLQVSYIDTASYVTLRSTVYSATGDAGTFIYDNIKSVGSGWKPGTGTFFYVFDHSTATVSLNSARTKCTVSGEMYKRNDDGLYLTGVWKTTIVFDTLSM